MSRKPTTKELEDTRLANSYGGWIYCGQCGKTVGYLCYVTYDSFRFEYQCKCGGYGRMHLAFREADAAPESDRRLNCIKNRLCCPADESPLFSVLEKNLEHYQYEAVCSKCGAKYREEK